MVQCIRSKTLGESASRLPRRLASKQLLLVLKKVGLTVALAIDLRGRPEPSLIKCNPGTTRSRSGG